MASVKESSGSGYNRRLQSFNNAVETGKMQDIRRHLSFLETKEDDSVIRETCLQAIHILIEKYDFPDVIDDILRSSLFKKKRACQHLRWEVPHFIYTAARSCQSLHQLRGFMSTLTAIKAISTRLAVSIDILNLQDSDGLSALHLSVIDGSEISTKNLLELGTDAQKTTRDGNTCLSLAIAMDHQEIVSLLLPCSDVNSSDKDGDTPLMYAAWRRQPALARQLIAAGADVNVESMHGTTALWNAVFRACPETVLILLQNNADMDVKCEGTRLFRSRNGDDTDNNDMDSEEGLQRVEKIYSGHKRSLLWVAADRIRNIHSYDRSKQILFTLLEAGYDVTKERWLSNLSGNVPKRHPNGFTENDSLREVLKFFFTRPQSLKDNCRGVLRRHLVHLQRQEFIDWLSHMNLGNIVIDFLSLDYIPLQ